MWKGWKLNAYFEYWCDYNEKHRLWWPVQFVSKQLCTTAFALFSLHYRSSSFFSSASTSALDLLAKSTHFSTPRSRERWNALSPSLTSHCNRTWCKQTQGIPLTISCPHSGLNATTLPNEDRKVWIGLLQRHILVLDKLSAAQQHEPPSYAKAT